MLVKHVIYLCFCSSQGEGWILLEKTWTSWIWRKPGDTGENLEILEILEKGVSLSTYG